MFQPIVLFLGVPKTAMVCASLCLILLRILFLVVVAWSNGVFNASGIFLLFFVSTILTRANSSWTRAEALPFYIRMFLLALLAGSLALGALELITTGQISGHGPVWVRIFQSTAVDTLGWVCVEYFSVCQDPPPRERFAWSPGAA